ncbi:MAG: autotransporter domain-containing protein [Candidatus Omnitrophica bacterium]|nr:autotransporter domain-containing protein [Candidatus Omnitrophota bacterium]MDD5737200.1 autotransporter domain-containing protein [Candidatus Omnitrophota bacterium]
MKGHHGFVALSAIALILSTGFCSYADEITVANDESKTWATDPATDGIRFTGTNATGTYATTGGADGNTIAAVTVDNTALLGVGTLDFYHNTTVSGNIGDENHHLSVMRLQAAGKTLTLEGDAYAETLDFGANGTVSIADNVNLTAAVTTSTPNTGTLDFAGTSTMNGQIGTAAKPLLLVNAANWPATLTLNGDVYASEIYIEDDGEIVFPDGTDYNRGATAGKITTEDDGYGYLLFTGSSVINGSVGTELLNIYDLRLDQANPTDVVEITGDLYAADGNGVNFDSDGELRIGGDFYGSIESDTGGMAGTVTFGGNAQIDWLGFPLRRVNANGTGTSIVVDSWFETETLNYGGDGDVDIGSGPITIGSVLNSSGTDGAGTFTAGDDGTITGNVGAPGASLKAIILNNDNITLDLQGDVYAKTLGFGAGAEHSDGEIEIGGTAVIGAVTTLYDDFGTLTFEGNGTVNGDMGADGTALRAVNIVGAAGTSVTVKGDIWAYDMSVDAGSLLLDGTFTDPGYTPLTLTYTADGTVTLTDGHNIISHVATNNDGQGTLNLMGTHTITGNIGGAGAALKLITLGGSGATVTQAGNTAVKGIGLGSNRMDIDGTFDVSDGGSITTGIDGASSCGKVVSTAAATVPATATVNVSVSGYVPSGATFTVVDGTGGTGVAGGIPVTSNSRILTFAAVAADSEDLILTATRSHSYGNATTGEASVIGAILEQIGESGASGDMLMILNELDSLPDDESLQAALDTLAPVVDSGAVTASNTSLNQFIATVIDRLGALFARSHGSAGGETGVSAGSEGKNGLEAWGQGFGEYVKQKPRGTSNGYRATVWGTALGADIPAFNDRVRLGLSGGYAATGINSKDNSGKTDIDSYQGTLYAGYIDPEHPYYLNGSFSFAYNKYEGKRHIAVGAITRTADADYDGQQYSVLFDGGYTFKARPVNITPIASLQYMRLHLEGYTETGAGALNLDVNSQNYDMLQSGLGVKFDRAFEAECGTVIPEVHVRWLHDFIGDRQETTSTFSGGGGSFAAQGFEPAQNALNVGAKLALITKGSWSLETNYDFEYKEDFAAHTGWAEARYRF